MRTVRLCYVARTSARSCAFACAALLFLNAPISLAAQTTPANAGSLIDSVTSLNRAGHWGQAAALAAIGLRQSTTTNDRCSLLVGSIYALVRLARVDSSRAEIRTYDVQCAGLPSSARYTKELESLRGEAAAATVQSRTDSTRALASPIPSTGFDFSAMDAFWSVVDTLSHDIEPSDSLWQSMFATPGYRMATRTSRSLERLIDVAFKPSDSLDRNQLSHTHGDDSATLAHLIDAKGRRAELIAMQRVLAATLHDSIAAAVLNASRYLPPGTTTHSAAPFVAFAIFANDGFAQEHGVIADLLMTREVGLTMLLSHEFQHVYAGPLSRDSVPSDGNDGLLYDVVRSLRNEGIADMVDKPYPLETLSPVMKSYVDAYNAAYARTPETLHALDSLLARAHDRPADVGRIGEQARRLLVYNSHPDGAYMAREVMETLGRDSLISAVYNPFDFVRVYAAAEQKRGRPAPFSPRAVAMLDQIEKRWVRARSR